MTPLTHSRGRICDLQPDDEVFIGDTPYFVKKVARGGMGLVLLMNQDSKRVPRRRNVHGLRVALKTILPDFLTDETKDMFRRELAVWTAFRHPNIVALNEILDSGPDGWVAAMDECLGSLREHLTKTKKLSLKEATDIFGNMLDGLAYAYNRDQVLHLDLKPENVLYHLHPGKILLPKVVSDSEHWYFKISDWGLASIKQEQLNKVIGLPRNSQFRMDTFNNVGTILYMAPERFVTGNRSSIASDIFSLGLIYLEMLAGRLPYSFQIDPMDELLSGSYFTNAQQLLRQEAVPESIQRIILDCISRNPDERPTSYEELRARTIVAYRTTSGAGEICTADDPLEEWSKKPEVRESMLFMEREYAAKQASNLRAAGREQDARGVAKRHLGKWLEEFKNEPQNPVHLTWLTNAAIQLQEIEFAKETIEAIIHLSEKHPFVDLTLAYFNLGVIHHQLRSDPEKELWCYEMAINAQPPPKCNHIASQRMKAKVHLFAIGPANRLMNFDLRDQHVAECRKLAPDVDFDDPSAEAKFVQETQT